MTRSFFNSPRESYLEIGSTPMNPRRTCAAALLFAAIAMPAAAQNYDIVLNAGDIEAMVIEQPAPNYPGHTVRSGQEGWVRMNYVVTADGTAIDPIIINSSGGAGFEQAAREVLTRWEFPARDSTLELPDNLVEVRYEIERGRDAATSNFLRRYRRIVTHLVNDEYDVARKLVDETQALGGWNLYESTMLWLMTGRVEGAEGNDVGKLDSYRRALAISNRNSLNGKDRRDVLVKIFELEYAQQQYAAAATTLALLRKEPGSDGDVAALQESIDAMTQLIGSDATLTAKATIQNPCDCDDGEPLWSYAPIRRAFSFANVSGNVERFEARCTANRIQGTVNADTTWELAEEWGRCHIFIFGDDGATFDFVEHGGDAVSDKDSRATLASNGLRGNSHD